MPGLNDKENNETLRKRRTSGENGFNQKINVSSFTLFLSLAVDKKHYILNIIENEEGPIRQKQARQAYAQFRQTVLNYSEPLAKVG